MVTAYSLQGQNAVDSKMSISDNCSKLVKAYFIKSTHSRGLESAIFHEYQITLVELVRFNRIVSSLA